VQPVCFWDVMPIPRHALTVRLLRAPAKPACKSVSECAASPRRARGAVHDYHPLHDKVNAAREFCKANPSDT
jgi:hypothetical protein